VTRHRAGNVRDSVAAAAWTTEGSIEHDPVLPSPSEPATRACEFGGGAVAGALDPDPAEAPPPA
jgi:hypothetical protein